jgi:hypothetical protein
MQESRERGERDTQSHATQPPYHCVARERQDGGVRWWRERGRTGAREGQDGARGRHERGRREAEERHNARDTHRPLASSSFDAHTD